ncbi:hypothetical protein DPEC_G00145180 [Dallia pectoralis]|uniref:Uncharacterized protein n=1 Tax=Dallia pectoralis TaxID=75939 RepID=A0ACC2GNU6_DALPE|nr:hypothetical protein DPEC_G00145180 [Dallia pectoralis]
MAGEELLQETVGAEVELLVGLRSANTQSPQDIPRFSVPLLFSMADDSSDDDCDLSGDSIFTCGLRSMELGGKCWECGEQIQSNKELIFHLENHKVSTSCNICQSRPWQEEFEEEEQMQDIKPLNVRVKVESGLEIDGAPIQWNEWMKEEESGERSEIIKVVEGEDDDRLTGAGVKMENDNSRQCEERSPKTVCAEKMDVLNGREQDKDAEMSNDEDSDSSGFERESEFDPGELTDSVSEESSMSSYSPVRTRSATMQPPVHGKDSTMCAVCGRGPFVNIDSHFNSCSGNWLFKCSECKIQLPSEKCLVDHNVRYHSAPSKPFNGFCVFCRDGPFTSLDLHKRICSKQKGSHCSVCKVFFPTELVLEEHMLRAHGTPNQVQSTNSETSNGERAGVHCARGPFTGLDVHLGVGSKKLIQCSLCKFFFPGDVLANHMISRHSTKSRVPSPVGENPDPDTRIGCSGTEPFSNLDSHMKTCCQTNCIRCSICKFFFSADVLADHMISYHGTEIQSPETECPQKSVCVNCGKGPFHSLEHHMRYCNKQNGIRCSMCETCFATEGRLLNHIVSAHADKPVTRPTLTSVPTAISTTSGQQSPGSATLTYYSSEVKELKQLTPVVSQGPSVVGPLPHTKLSAVSLPRVMLSTTSSSPSFPSSTVPVMATLVMNNSPGEMPRLVPMVTLPRLQFIDTTQTQRAKPSWQILNSVQQKQTIQPTVPVTHHTSSPITPSPKPGTAAEQVTVIRLFPALPQTQSVVLPPAPAPLSIMYMFVNISRKLALEKRMKMSWRSKGAYTCRQCGAVSRQPSLAVRHRYLHRGLRRYRCHCGRSFLRRMHLLRHYFLHAQATRYICTSCGQTFDGVRGLTQHLTVAADAAKCPGNRGTLQPRQECRMAFTCHCGQVFCRPAAFLWHKLKSTQRV